MCTGGAASGSATRLLRVGGKSRKGNKNRRPGSAAVLDGDVSAVVLDDLAAQGQADAGALVAVAGMQALEDDEHALGVLGLDADAVVRDPDLPFDPRPGAGHL